MLLILNFKQFMKTSLERLIAKNKLIWKVFLLLFKSRIQIQLENLYHTFLQRD